MLLDNLTSYHNFKICIGLERSISIAECGDVDAIFLDVGHGRSVALLHPVPVIQPGFHVKLRVGDVVAERGSDGIHLEGKARHIGQLNRKAQVSIMF